MGYESIIGKAILGLESESDCEAAVGLLAAVQQQMFCSCGQILDVRRAVLVESGRSKGAGISCAACFDKLVGDSDLAEAFVESGGTITDGRELHKKKLV